MAFINNSTTKIIKQFFALILLFTISNIYSQPKTNDKNISHDYSDFNITMQKEHSFLS